MWGRGRAYRRHRRAAGGRLDRGRVACGRATVDGVEVAGLDTVAVTMLIAGGQVSGSSGCNEYDRPVDIASGTIEFGGA